MNRLVNICQPETTPENIFIRQIWRAKDTPLEVRTEKVLPKGTAELIFNLSGGGIFRSKAGEPTQRVPEYFINGLNFTPVDLRITQSQYFIGIKLNIFALKYLFDTPVAAFNDRMLEGSLICKSLTGLVARLKEADSFTEQVGYIRLWLRDKIKQAGFCEVNQRIISLHTDPEVINLSVRSMSEKYNVSSRHLNRLCSEYFGMCPEDLILYRKYLLALHQLHQLQYSLTDIAYTSGFYDQAHFTRTFKLFTGISPRGYRKSVGELPGHLFDFAEDAKVSLPV